MWEWECGEGEGLQLEHHWRGGMGPLQVWYSVVLGRPAVNFLQQEEVRMEGEQHQRARIDSDHHSAHIPLQGEKKDKISALSTLSTVSAWLNLYCFCSVVKLTFLLAAEMQLVSINPPEHQMSFCNASLKH